MNSQWKKLRNKEVTVIINDKPFVSKKEGIFIDIDETHIFIMQEGKEIPTPLLRTDIKRIDIKNGK